MNKVGTWSLLWHEIHQVLLTYTTRYRSKGTTYPMHSELIITTNIKCSVLLYLMSAFLPQKIGALTFFTLQHLLLIWYKNFDWTYIASRTISPSYQSAFQLSLTVLVCYRNLIKYLALEDAYLLPSDCTPKQSYSTWPSLHHQKWQQRTITHFGF